MATGEPEDNTVLHLSPDQCKRELETETDVNILRALVSAKRKLLTMRRRSQTGVVEMSVQTGIVKWVSIPDKDRVA